MNGFWSTGVMVVLAVGLSAQAPQTPQTPQPPQAATPPQTAPPQQRPTFTVSIDLVTNDIIVRDEKGNFIPDLKKDDFEIFEDGVKQEVTSMQVITGGRVTNVLAPPPPPPPEGIILPPTKPRNDTSGRIFMFFVDDLHMQFHNTGRIRDLFKKIAGSELKPSDIIQGPSGAEGPSEVRYRAHVAFSTVNDVLTQLEQIHNRRKALVYVSDGYDFNPFQDARLGLLDPNSPFAQNEFAKQQNQISNQNASDAGTSAQPDPFASQQKTNEEFADADLARELGDLTRTANRANVTMYTIDPRGLVGMGDIDQQVDPSQWNEYVRKSQDSLRVIAEETGGIAVVNQNDFSKALKRIDAETSDYYVLGYYSNNPDPTRRRRQMTVKVNRPGVSVWARKEYVLKAAPKPATTKKQ